MVTQNIVRAAAWLLFTLAGTAGIFFLLGADFVGATQLIVYVGGTLVLVVFGVMLTAQGPFVTMKTGAGRVGRRRGRRPAAVRRAGRRTVGVARRRPTPARRRRPTPATSLSSVQLGAGVARRRRRRRPTADAHRLPDGAGSRRPRTQIGYLLPFEIVSVHLLVVLIGAAYLARAKRRREATA